MRPSVLGIHFNWYFFGLSEGFETGNNNPQNKGNNPNYNGPEGKRPPTLINGDANENNDGAILLIIVTYRYLAPIYSESLS